MVDGRNDHFYLRAQDSCFFCTEMLIKILIGRLCFIFVFFKKKRGNKHFSSQSVSSGKKADY